MCAAPDPTFDIKAEFRRTVRDCLRKGHDLCHIHMALDEVVRDVRGARSIYDVRLDGEPMDTDTL